MPNAYNTTRTRFYRRPAPRPVVDYATRLALWKADCQCQVCGYRRPFCRCQGLTDGTEKTMDEQ